MKPTKFKYANRCLGKPKDWPEGSCDDLPIFTNGAMCISKWRMTWRERLSALIFGTVWANVYSGATQPPVFLWVHRSAFKEQKKAGWATTAEATEAPKQ